MKLGIVSFLLLTACASVPKGAGDHRMPLAEKDPGKVREVAIAAVEDVAHPSSLVRVTDGGSILTEGWIGACGRDVTCSTRTAHSGYVDSPWTTIEVRVQDLGASTAVEVAIEYESCEPDVSCAPERYASTGEMEIRILEEIRSRLDADDADDRLERARSG